MTVLCEILSLHIFGGVFSLLYISFTLEAGNAFRLSRARPFSDCKKLHTGWTGRNDKTLTVYLIEE